ncbi:MAG: hypothetical protein QOK37_3651 [Thermoanaerobaculia bacterium]|jgi:hypothetical protein|nr:hypothetical protein [Thermoanaerobaculia bacterium]
MKILLFEDAEKFGVKIIAQVLANVPDAEILWFGTVKNHIQPPIPNPFAVGSMVLRDRCKVVTTSGSKTQEVDVWPGELSGAILDIYVNTTRVGENIARWLEYAQFSGPVLLCSGLDLPPVMPALPRIFSGIKEKNLTQQVDVFCGLLDSNTRVNSRGVPSGGGDIVRTYRRQKHLIWEWFSPRGDVPAFTSLFGPGERLTELSLASNVLLAWNLDVEPLRGLRNSNRNPYPFYLVVEREKLGIGAIEALAAGIIYLDQQKLVQEPLRFALQTAEEFLYRYIALTKKYSQKTLNQIDRNDAPLLAQFVIAFARAIAFSGGWRSLYRTRNRLVDGQRIGWIEELTGVDFSQSFEKEKKSLLTSATNLSLIPSNLRLP